MISYSPYVNTYENMARSYYILFEIGSIHFALYYYLLLPSVNRLKYQEAYSTIRMHVWLRYLIAVFNVY